MGGLAIPIALAVGGALLQQKAIGDANKSRSRATAAMLQRQSDYADKKAGLVLEGTQDWTVDATREGLGREAQSAEAAMRNTLATYRSPDAVGDGYQGNMSNDAVAQASESSAKTLQRAWDMARKQSKVLAPDRLNFDRALSSADMASRRNLLHSDAQGQARVDEARIASIQPSGLMMMLGDLAQTGAMFAGSGGLDGLLKPSASKAWTGRPGNLTSSWG